MDLLAKLPDDCIRSDYVRRSSVDYCHRSEKSARYQEDVYRMVAEHPGIDTVYDIGCGHGEKLVSMFPGRSLCGVDFGPNIDWCRKNQRGAAWWEADLESNDLRSLTPGVRTAIICADVIEHLVNLGPLLTFLRRASRKAGLVVISTPDRELIHGFGCLGPPVNRCHAREWTTMEFSRLLRKNEIDATVGLVRQDDSCDRPSTIVAVSGIRSR